MGLNIVPLYPREKVPYGKWAALRFTPLPADEKLLDLLFSGRAGVGVITGRLSGNLVLLDAETASRFEDIAGKLKDAGIPLFGVRSGSGRGGHFYVRCAEGVVRNFTKLRGADGEIIPDLEIFGKNHIGVLPPSLHPKTGNPYTFYEGNTASEPPTVSLEALQAAISPALEVVNKMFADGEHSAPLPPYSRRTAFLLEQGAEEGTRHIEFVAAAWDLAGCGYSRLEVETMLQRAGNRCNFPDEDPRELDRIIRDAFSEEREPSRRNLREFEPPAHFDHYERAKEWAQSQAWRGLTGATDRAVFLAFCERAKQAQESQFRASTRELADLAQKSRNSISGQGGKPGAIHRLIARKAIIRVATDDSGAGIWEFHPSIFASEVARLCATAKDRVLDSGSNSRRFQVAAHDLKEHGAVGETAMQVWACLVDAQKSLRAAEIALASKLSVDQCRRALTKLHKLGLVRKPRFGWWEGVAKSAQELAGLARQLGVDGHVQARKERHAQERVKLAVQVIIDARLADPRNLGEAKAFRDRLADYREGRLAGQTGKRLYCQHCGFAVQNAVMPDKCPACGVLDPCWVEGLPLEVMAAAPPSATKWRPPGWGEHDWYMLPQVVKRAVLLEWRIYSRDGPPVGATSEVI